MIYTQINNICFRQFKNEFKTFIIYNREPALSLMIKSYTTIFPPLFDPSSPKKWQLCNCYQIKSVCFFPSMENKSSPFNNLLITVFTGTATWKSLCQVFSSHTIALSEHLDCYSSL